MFPLADVPVGDTLYLPFDTYDSNRASVTITGLAVTDIEIYKDGGTTPRASDNGYTLLDTDGIDFAGVVGLHGFSIDLSDNSDAGFYAAGSTYWLNVDAITVDSQTVRFTYHFTIGKLLRPTTAGRTLTVSANGEGNADLTFIHGTALTETAAQLAGAFSKFFDVAAPTGTVNSLPDAAPDAAGGLPISDAGGLDLDTLLDAAISTRAAGTLFTGITLLAQWLGAMAGKQTANATALEEIKATGVGGGTFNPLTDSGEGLADYMSAAYASLYNGHTAISGYVDCLPVTLDGSTLTALPDMTLEDDAITAPKIVAAACNKIADHVKRRTQGNTEASSDGDTIADDESLYGMVQQLKESNTTEHAGKLTIFKTDGTTEIAQRTLATDAAADPTTGIS